MKKYLKILAGLVAIAILGLACDFVLYLRYQPVDCGDRYTLTGGRIVSETFVQTRKCLARFKAEKKTFVVKDSEGGDGFAALAMGILLHQHNWDVEVVGVCPSSCANWLFTAGKTKYLTSDSLLLFHGGPRQKNMLEFMEKLDHDLASGTPVDSMKFGREGKEGNVTWGPHRSAADDEVLEFLSINKDLPVVEKWRQFMQASDKFYQELGINPLLPEYGQMGGYEPSYKSDKYGGFVYSLDSLRKLGVRNIELKDGEWHPERNPAYPDVYEVTYP